MLEILNKKNRLSVIVSLSLFLVPVEILALPTGASVDSGKVTINTSKNTMIINASNRAIINYKSFNIGANELVKFIQPNSSAVVLNRVVLANPSTILGTLSANGNVFLVNPAGIYFGAHSVINANSFLASTLDISDENFLKGNYRFEQIKNIAPSYIIQKGAINVSPEGFVVLAAPFVSSEGAILAKSGKVEIGATDNFYIHFDAKGLINYSYNKTSADDTPIVLPAKAADDIINNIINTGPASNAIKIVKNGDEVKLVGADNTAFVSSNINTDAADGKNAGSITVYAQKQSFVFNGAKLSSNAGDIGNGGNIHIYSNDLTYSDRGAFFSAVGGLSKGDGGFLEISADKKVIFDGSAVSLYALQGKDGLFYIDPEDDITVTNNTILKGGNIKWSTDGSFVLNDGVIVSTRNIKGDDYENADSIGNSGNIEINASNITLGAGSKLLSFANNGYTSGDIILNASASSSDIGVTATSFININGAVLKGGNINILAEANANNSFGSGEQFIKHTLDFLASSNDNTAPVVAVGLSIAKSKATINIGNGSYIEGNSINITSNSTSKDSVLAGASVVGVGYGQSVTDAETIIQNGASLKSNGDINIKSNSISDNSVKIYTQGADDSAAAKANVNLGYAITTTISKAIIENGVNITANKALNVNAYTEKTMNVSADSGSNNDRSLGASVAISNSDSTTEASVGGKINVGTLTINSQTDNNALETLAYAGDNNPSIEGVILNKADGLSKTVQNWVLNDMPSFESEIPAQEQNDKTSSPLGLSAAFAYSDHTSTIKADIAKNSNINVNGNTEIKALNNYLTSDDGESGIKTVAIASVPGTKNGTKTYSAAGAVTVTKLDNTVNAYIDDGAILNSKGNIVVSANTKIPYQIAWDQLTDVSDINKTVNTALNIKKTAFFTTWAQSSASGQTVGLAGSVNYFHMKNDTEAYLGEDTQINQGQNEYGTLSVNALTDIETMNLSGVVGLGNSATTGLGGSYLDIKYDDITKAEIKNNSKILTQQLKVEANTNTKNISIATSGETADQYGVSGSVSYLDINNTTLANINTANLVITGNNPVTNGIDLSSNDYSKLFNITGAVMFSKSLGIGVSVSINEITRDTEANLKETEFENAYDTNITSVNSGEIETISLAGAVSTLLGTQESQDSMAGSFGIGISGDVSLNRIKDTTIASITDSDNKADKNNLNDIFVTSENTSSIKSFAGAVSIVAAIKSATGLAGSYAENDLNNTTSATINSSVIYAKNLLINANSTGTIDSYTASLSGSISTRVAVSVAGSVSINNILDSITANIENNSDVTTDKSIKLSAQDKSDINTMSGGIAISGAGIGASFSKNHINNSINSYITDSKISSGSLDITSNESGEINSLSASLGASAEGMAVLAAIVINDIADNIDAYIDNSGKTILTNGDISISADDNSNIGTQAGQGSGSDGSVLGLATLYNTIGNNISSYIKNATVQSDGNIIISSISNKSIDVKAAGVSVSGSASAAGTVVINTIKDTINSYILYSSIVSDNSISIFSEEENILTSMSGILSLGVTLGGDGSIITNIIENTLSSYIKNSNVKAEGNAASSTLKADGNDDSENINGIDLLAYANEKISSYVANLSGSVSTSVAASVSVNLLKDNLNSYINNSNINSDNENANSLQSVGVRAISNNDLKSYIGGLAIGKNIGMGASSDTDIFQNSVNAYIDSSNVNAKKSVNVISQSLDYLNSKVVSGGISGGISIAGSCAVINVDNNNSAYILNSSVNSEGDLGISSSDTTYLGTENNGTVQGILAGSTGIGLAGGVGGSVVVTNVTQNTNAYAQDSILNAKGTTSILANNYADIVTFAATGDVGAFVGAAGSVTINTIDSKAKAYTYASGVNKMLINQDSNYKTSSQDVTIKSNNHSSIDSSPGAGSGGVVGGSGSIDVATIHNTTLAELGNDTLLNAGRNFLISANAYKSVTSTVQTLSGSLAGGVSGSVSIANINANINDDASDASKDTKDKTDTLMSKESNLSCIGDSDTAINTQNEINVVTKKMNVDDVFDSDYASDETTQAVIGDNSILNVGELTSVGTSDTTKVNLLSGGISASGVLGAGGGVSIANIGVDTKAYIGQNAIINTGALNINSDLILKKNSVKSYAGGVGAVGIGAAVSEFNVNYKNEAYTNSNSVLTITNGNFNIEASNDLSSNSVAAYGAATGAAAGGIVKAEFIQKGSITSIVKSSKVNVSGNINISASDNEFNSSSLSQAAAGGIISGTGSFSNINLTPTLFAGFGDGVTSTSNGDTSIISSAIASISSNAEGVNGALGGFTFGASEAILKWTPTLISETGSDNNIKANNFYMKAYENTDDSGNYLTDNIMHANAYTTSGGSLYGNIGSISDVNRTAYVLSQTGDNTKINTNQNIYIDSKAFSKVNSISSGVSYKIDGNGTTNTYLTNNAEVSSLIAADNTITSGRDISIIATARNESFSQSLGGTGSINAETGASAVINTVIGVYVTIDKGAKLLANGNITLNALSYISSQADASITTATIVSANRTESNITVSNNSAVNINENTQLKANNINILAEVTNFDANASAKSETISADSNSEAYANINAATATNVHIKTGADLEGASGITIVSKQDDKNTFLSETDANGTIKAGLTGSLKAVTNNVMTVNSNAVFDSGSKLTTTNLQVETFAPKKSEDTYVNEAYTKSNTVVTYILEQTKKLVSILSNIPFIGPFIENVWETVDEWVPKITNSEQVKNMTGSYNYNSEIQMNSDIYQRTSVSQSLNVAADGTITAEGGDISAQNSGNNIVVNDLINHDKGSIVLNSSGQLTGTSNIYFDNKYPDVTINNYSNKNLELNNINVASDNENEPNLQLYYVQNSDTAAFTPIYHTLTTGHSVNINNYGLGNIIFNGVISNYAGDISVYNSLGNIYANSGSLLSSENININAEKGSIGSKDNFMEIELQKTDDTDPALVTNSFYNTYMGIKVSKLSSEQLNDDYLIDGIDLSSIKTGGEMSLEFNPGFTYEYYIDSDTEQQVTKNILQTQADSKYYINKIFANGNINIEAEKGVSLVLKGTLQSGMTDQTVNIQPVIELYKEDTRYISSYDDGTVYLNNIIQPGGIINVTLNGATLQGNGNINYVNGYTHVNINNFSDKSINLQKINTGSLLNSGFYINGVKQQNIDNIAVNGIGYKSGSVVVNSNNGGDIQLNGNIENQSGTTEINGNSGVYNLGSNIIDSKDIAFNFTNGSSIGTQTNPIYINGSIKSLSDGEVYLFAPALMAVDSITGKDVHLRSNGDIEGLDDSKVNIIADNLSLEANGNIYSALTNALNVSADVLAAKSNRNMQIHNDKNTVIGSVGMLNGLYAIKDITFNSDGTFTQVKGSGIVSSSGNIALNSVENMKTGYIKSLKTVELISRNGAITQNDDAYVIANDLLMKAANGIGDNGVDEKYINTDVNYLDAYNSLDNDINIKNDKSLTAADLDSDSYALYNKNGNINIISAGTFTQQTGTKITAQDVSISAEYNALLSYIKAQNVYLTSLNGNIFVNEKNKYNIVSSNDIKLKAVNGIIATPSNPLNVSAGGDISITARKSKDLLSAYVNSSVLPSNSFVNMDLVVFNNRIISGTLIDLYDSTLYSVFNNMYHPVRTAAPREKKEKTINNSDFFFF